MLACIIIIGCSPVRTTTVWKNDHAFPGNYNKILIAAIVDSDDTALRAAIETGFKETLQSTGYQTVSSLKEFGIHGLRDLEQEDTYLRLCNKGIDAVMTVALIDRTDGNYTEPKSSYSYPVRFYYDRIWHYKNRPSNYSATFYDFSKKYLWELILFDLSTLQPHSIIHSEVYTNGISESTRKEFWKEMIKKLEKDRFLKKRHPVFDPSPEGPKAF